MADQVLIGLQKASSQDPQLIKEAEALLKEWQIMPDFYRTLANIFSNPTITEDIRLMSFIWLKIGIDRYWQPKKAK